jgi:hypothetical protein
MLPAECIESEHARAQRPVAERVELGRSLGMAEGSAQIELCQCNVSGVQVRVEHT